MSGREIWAIKLANKYNNAIKTERVKSNHIAIIANKRQIIGIGVNIAHKTSPLSNKYGNQYSIHAEVAAIIDGRQYDYKGCDIFVFRFRSNGKLAMSRPCDKCMATIRDFNFRNIYYSDNDGRIIQE